MSKHVLKVEGKLSVSRRELAERRQVIAAALATVPRDEVTMAALLLLVKEIQDGTKEQVH